MCLEALIRDDHCAGFCTHTHTHTQRACPSPFTTMTFLFVTYAATLKLMEDAQVTEQNLPSVCYLHSCVSCLNLIFISTRLLVVVVVLSCYLSDSKTETHTH
ncbi:hypothetical protein KIL84_001449 [Mauremys mutica]|uniref:Uncharacterized protein n=1 Tax=Mauremys mutica TaxID=74926 RepID=A0A9D3WYI5_9SAUR|nr:hypothetical protein KIL84_001449 [Mauremys mutica]